MGSIGFRVSSMGFRISGSGFLGFLGLGFKVLGIWI